VGVSQQCALDPGTVAECELRGVCREHQDHGGRGGVSYTGLQVREGGEL